MRLGILTLSIIPENSITSYNLQEVGLARALSPFCDDIQVWRPTDGASQSRIDVTENIKIYFFHSAHLGSNGLIDLTLLDNRIDTLICFSDLQISFGKVYRWAKKNNIRVFPYIGTLSSRSNSIIVKTLMDGVSLLNQLMYRNMVCFAKNDAVMEKLQAQNRKKVYLVTPGISVCAPEINPSLEKIKKDFGISGDEKIILFVGRLEKEKRAYEMVEIFHKLLKKNDSYRLLMIGRGSLESKIYDYIQDNQLGDKINMVPYVENSEMWRAYLICHCLVNLNKGEIVGMAILEAMFFGKIVIAESAPGPCTIIEDGISGYIADNSQMIIDRIINGNLSSETIKKRILENFTLDKNAQKIYDIISID